MTGPGCRIYYQRLSAARSSGCVLKTNIPRNCSTGMYGCEARASGGGNITGFTCFRVVSIKRGVTPLLFLFKFESHVVQARHPANGSTHLRRKCQHKHKYGSFQGPLEESGSPLPKSLPRKTTSSLPADGTRQPRPASKN